MAHYRTEITTPASPRTSFDWMLDFSNAQDWDPGVHRSVRLDAGPIVVGSAFDVDVAFAGRSLTMRYEVVELDAPHRFVLRSRTPMFISVDTVSVRPAGDGAVVTYDADLRLRGLLRLGDPVLALAFQKIGDAAAEGLRTHLRDLPVDEEASR